MGRLQEPVDEDAPEPMRELARRLRNLMNGAGYSGVRELADAAGLGRTVVSDALGGGRAPSWRTLGSILRACEIQPETAWRRAQEEAKAAERRWKRSKRATAPAELAVEDERTAFPGTFSIRPPFGELPPRVRGRDELLTALQNRLDAPAGRIQVLHGLGGCGKTAIALQIAQYAREQGYMLLWVSALGQDQLISGMREVARQLGAPEKEIEDAWAGQSSAMDLTWRHLDSAPGRWLLVVDNADEPELLASEGGSPGDGTGWARPSHVGLTVITSRIGTAEIWGGEAERHSVGVLDPDDGADVLIDLAGHADTRDIARALAERLGGLPLALRLAGSYIARTARGAGLLRHRGQSARVRTFAAYIEALGDIGTALLDEGARGDLAPDRQTEHLHRRLIGRTWEITLNLLDTQGFPEARTLLRLLSCFAPAPFPVDLIDLDLLAEHGLLPQPPLIDRVDLALEALVDLNLLEVIEVNDVVPCIMAHRLVLESNAHRLHEGTAAERIAVWRAAAGALPAEGSPPPELPKNWDWWGLLEPHVQAAIKGVPSDIPDAMAQTLRSGLPIFAYLWFQGNFEGGQVLVQLMRRRAEDLEPTHPVRLSIRHRHALANLDGGEEEAEYVDILEAQRNVLGPDHPETLITHHQWAESLRHKDQLSAAEAEFRVVLAARRRVLGSSDPYTLLTKAELAGLMSVRGHQEQADAHYQEIIKESGSGRRFLPRSARHTMVHMLDSDERYEEAEQEYRSILAEIEDEGAADGVFYREMKLCLARNLSKQHRHSSALAEFEECCALAIGSLNADHPTVLSIRHERADELSYLGEHDRAEREFRSVLEIRQRSVQNDSAALNDGHCLAHALARQQKYDDAAEELHTAAQAYEELLGPESEAARRVRYCLGNVWQSAERWTDAQEAYERVLAAETAALGVDHSDTLVTRLQLVKVRHSRELISTETALAEVEEILAAQIAAVGEDHRRVRQIHKLRDELR